MATIKAERRENISSRANRRLRKAGYLTASICGKEMKPVSLKVKRDELRRVIARHGRSSLFNIDLGAGETYTAMVKDIQYSPVTIEPLDVEFQKVSLSEEIKVNLEVKIAGKEAIENKRLILVQQINEIPVKGLPQDMPDYIEVDVSDLNLGDKISVGDIKYPKGIEPEMEKDQIVLSITASSINVADEEVQEEAEAK